MESTASFPETLASKSPSRLEAIGIPPVLLWGFVGLLLFMIGDGVESGFLTPYLVSRGLTIGDAATISSVYGAMAALAGWLSGALSDVWGPRRVIKIGLILWLLFQVLFLTLGLQHAAYPAVLMTYGLRGLGYPLFAFGFLVWITLAAPKHRLASAMGWFWFAFTGGLPTLGSQVARLSIPYFGQYGTFWIATALVLIGGAVLLIGVREPRGSSRLIAETDNPFHALLNSVTLAWRKPKTGIACIVRVINTAPEFGFFVILPAFFEDRIGLTQAQFLTLLGAIFLSNIIWNLLFGLIGDRFGWRQTVAICGGLGCTITTLALYYVPLATKSYGLSVAIGMLYGATLAGYVPLSALAPMLAPENRGEALSLLSLGAGGAMLVGPGLVRIFYHSVGIGGLMWIFAGLYLLSSLLAWTLTIPNEPHSEI
jgi:polyol permease family